MYYFSSLISFCEVSEQEENIFILYRINFFLFLIKVLIKFLTLYKNNVDLTYRSYILSYKRESAKRAQYIRIVSTRFLEYPVLLNFQMTFPCTEQIVCGYDTFLRSFWVESFPIYPQY